MCPRTGCVSLVINVSSFEESADGIVSYATFLTITVIFILFFDDFSRCRAASLGTFFIFCFDVLICTLIISSENVRSATNFFDCI